MCPGKNYLGEEVAVSRKREAGWAEAKIAINGLQGERSSREKEYLDSGKESLTVL